MSNDIVIIPEYNVRSSEESFWPSVSRHVISSTGVSSVFLIVGNGADVNKFMILFSMVASDSSSCDCSDSSSVRYFTIFNLLGFTLFY
jgi:hypothetical protein